MRNGLDWMGRTWNEWVIAFDAARQVRLLERFGLERFGQAVLVLLLGLSFAAIAAVVLPLLWRLRARRSRDPAPWWRRNTFPG